MTDEELKARLKKADELMYDYHKLVYPAAKELAKRRGLAVFNDESAYEAFLGSEDLGPDVIFLASQRADSGSEYNILSENWYKDNYHMWEDLKYIGLVFN